MIRYALLFLSLLLLLTSTAGAGTDYTSLNQATVYSNYVPKVEVVPTPDPISDRSVCPCRSVCKAKPLATVRRVLTAREPVRRLIRFVRVRHDRTVFRTRRGFCRR